MKIFLVTIMAFLSVNGSFANSDVCRFNTINGSYRVRFDYGKGDNRKDVQVILYRNNKVQISHTTQTHVDSDSYGDGWSMILKDRNHPQYEYDLYFDADVLNSIYLTMPGMIKFKVDSCVSLNN